MQTVIILVPLIFEFSIEEQRATAELAMLDTAVAEMSELTKIVVADQSIETVTTLNERS